MRNNAKQVASRARRPRHARWQVEVDVDGADRACSKLREMMHEEAKASLKAWRTTQRALNKQEKLDKRNRQLCNAATTQIHKSVRRHSSKPLSARNKQRIDDLKRHAECQRRHIRTLARQMKYTEKHKDNKVYV